MLAVNDLEIRVGARLLMSEVTFRVDRGDKIGLVGRNGAGKTTLTKTLAGQAEAAAGTITRTGEIGYLPQDPRAGNLDDTARTRILDARGLGHIVLQLQQSTLDMASTDEAVSQAGMAAYARLEDRFLALGGYAAEAEAAAIASNLALPDRILDQPLKTLSGGQRRRIELPGIRTIEVGVLLFADLRLGASPQGSAVGDLIGLGIALLAQEDGYGDMA